MNQQQALASVTPSGASEAGESSIHLESALDHGQPVTVARDAGGSIAYPAYVPPETTSPTSLPSPNSPTSLAQGHSLRRSAAVGEQAPSSGGPRKLTSDPPRLEKPTRPDPSVGKKWATEMPRGNQRRSLTLPTRLTRSGTNASELNRALWSRHDCGLGDQSSSDSSSSDEEDEQPGGGVAAGKPRPRQKPGDDQYRRFHVGNEHYRTKGKVSKKDGRLNITLHDKSSTGYLAKALGSAVKRVVPLKGDEGAAAGASARPSESSLSMASTSAGVDNISCPKLNIVIMVIGSRGDAQPFLKIGQVLKEQYGHRVRIATHPAFRDFVEKDSGLEFFSVGGDPSELMAFMVKNPGMIPTLETVRAGDIGKRRAAMAEMFHGFWRACIDATDDEKDIRNIKLMGDRDPFVPDAIIANPPSFAHIHCAEALGIPLHIMFTFPYTPTQAFPHPLASIKKSNVDPGYTNFISYPLVEMMVWQGLGDLVNDFRVKSLGLDPVSTLWAPGALYRLHVPATYLWSPGLVPKPEDWGEEIDVSGFVFLDLASSFAPPDPLTKFLDSGDVPIYIGFGSIVVDDADRFTQMIFDAVELAGVRALVSKGWGGLGGDSLDVPDNIFLLDNTPHDWLFPKVRACVIHGGAGTTAIALKCGIPTFIVPFFGDQHFWGSMVASAKAGPEPVAYKHLTAEKLADGIRYCLTSEASKAAGEIATNIEREGDGAENACRSFHRHLTLSDKNSMRCSILEDRAAAWHLKKTNIRLSPLAAYILTDSGCIPWRKLRLLRLKQYNDFEGPGEPLTGAAGSLMSSLGDVFAGVGGVPYQVAKSSNKRFARRQRKKVKKKEQVLKAKAVDGRGGPDKVAHATGDSNGQDGTLGPRDSPAQPTEATDHATHKEEALVPGFNEGPGQQALGENKELPPISTSTNKSLHRADTQQTASTVELENPAEEFVNHVGRGAFKSASALAKAPVDLSVAVAQGFHNAPRLYGDDTVRRPPRVTGVRSGLRAAGHEFTYGIYDGWTGLVRLPVRGARNGGGVRGFVTGMGMGLTGFVLKDIAAFIGPIGYTLKGLVKQAERRRQPTKYIRRVRIIQGQREARALDEEQRKDVTGEVARGWEIMRALWEALELEEKKKGRFWRRRGTRGGRGLGAAFGGVAIAERALAAVRRGEGLEGVLDEQAGRRSGDGGRHSLSGLGRNKKYKIKADDGERKSFATDETRNNELDSLDKGNPSHARTLGGGSTGRRGGKRVSIAGETRNGMYDNGEVFPEGPGPGGANRANTPVEEKRNPFAASADDMAKTRADNEQGEARALDVVAEHS